MANNIPVKDASGVMRAVKSTDNSGVHTPHNNAELMVNGVPVGANNRVPIIDPIAIASGMPVISGGLNTTTVSATFTPQTGRPINLTLYGSWTGTVTLKRQLPGDDTPRALTERGQPYGVFTGNISEPVWTETEYGTTFVLDFVRTSGTLNFRFSQ